MRPEINYIAAPDGLGFFALCCGRRVGEITFVRVGVDKMIIDHTGVNSEYRGLGIGIELLRCAVRMAREQNRKIIAMCPFAHAMFCRNPEFDDVRLILAH
ncbi:MAG: N-acetyltransferase [Alphaproteobacteria bacterium]|nr:N-acetyltransferase [Alphaproteobacteria bacterium]